MKVILLADVKGTGKKGQIVEVSDGYAKNCLLKTNKAVMATNSQLNQHQGKTDADAYHQEQRRLAAVELAKKLNQKQIKIFVKCGENGKIFGSVTSKEISEQLAKEGLDVDKRKIELDGAIKTVGSYQIAAKLHPGVNAKFTLEVIAQQ